MQIPEWPKRKAPHYKRNPKQCPECKRWCGSQGNLAQHAVACWGNAVPILDEATENIWWYWKLKRKSTNSRVGIEFHLTATEMVRLFEDAGITPAEVGTKRGSYVLSRDNDQGHYEFGNCRFVTVIENHRYRKKTQGGEKAI